jgi:hypothetical protein
MSPRRDRKSETTTHENWSDSGFESQASAETAGNQELKDFLEALAKEQKRTR